jgi:hypothetical protein
LCGAYVEPFPKCKSVVHYVGNPGGIKSVSGTHSLSLLSMRVVTHTALGGHGSASPGLMKPRRFRSATARDLQNVPRKDDVGIFDVVGFRKCLHGGVETLRDLR